MRTIFQHNRKTDMSLEVHDERMNGERLTDESDMASRAEARAIMDALDGHRERANVKLDPDFDGVHCVECGSEIPKARLVAIRTDLCIECKTNSDIRKKQYIH